MATFSSPVETAETKPQDDLIPIGRAWQHKDKNGAPFYSISIDKLTKDKKPMPRITIGTGDTLFLFQNSTTEDRKAAGKRDAALRLYVVEKVA